MVWGLATDPSFGVPGFTLLYGGELERLCLDGVLDFCLGDGTEPERLRLGVLDSALGWDDPDRLCLGGVCDFCLGNGEDPERLRLKDKRDFALDRGEEGDLLRLEMCDFFISGLELDLLLL